MNQGNKHVGDDIVSGWRISTVWIGMDDNFGLSDKPSLFETMIFGNDNWTGEFMWRYSTWEEAEKGHKLAIDLVSQKYLKRITKDDQ